MTTVVSLKAIVVTVLGSVLLYSGHIFIGVAVMIIGTVLHSRDIRADTP